MYLSPIWANWYHFTGPPGSKLLTWMWPGWSLDVIYSRTLSSRSHSCHDCSSHSLLGMGLGGHCHWLEYAYDRTDRVCFLAIYVPERVFTKNLVESYANLLITFFRKRKGMGSEAALAHPHTKIKEEPPLVIMPRLFEWLVCPLIQGYYWIKHIQLCLKLMGNCFFTQSKSMTNIKVGQEFDLGQMLVWATFLSSD